MKKNSIKIQPYSFHFFLLTPLLTYSLFLLVLGFTMSPRPLVLRERERVSDVCLSERYISLTMASLCFLLHRPYSCVNNNDNSHLKNLVIKTLGLCPGPEARCPPPPRAVLGNIWYAHVHVDQHLHVQCTWPEANMLQVVSAAGVRLWGIGLKIVFQILNWNHKRLVETHQTEHHLINTPDRGPPH